MKPVAHRPCQSRGRPGAIERERVPAAQFRTVTAGYFEAAGIPHSAVLGFVTATPSVFIRKAAKEHGTKRRVEGGVRPRCS